MPSASDLLAAALGHLDAGRLQQAELICRQVLERDPRSPEAWMFLGLISSRTQNITAAVEHFQHAIRLKPDYAEALFNLGLLYQQQHKTDEAADCYQAVISLNDRIAQAHFNLGGIYHAKQRLGEAEASYRRALALNPDYALAYEGLGSALRDHGKLDYAIACYRQSAKLRPDHAPAQGNLAAALVSAGRWADAEESFRRAVDLKPDYAAAYYGLGCTLREQRKWREAADCFTRAVELQPDNPEAHNALGAAYQEQGLIDDAMHCYDRALSLKPDFAPAYNNLGGAFIHQGNWLHAQKRFRQAIEIKPDYAAAYNGLGCALKEQAKWDEADECFRRALELRPDYVEAHLNRAMLLLLFGKFDEGWPEYEWRTKSKDFNARIYKQPTWNGESLVGRSMLIHAEQGLGDTIQFVRYAKPLERLGATVVLQCPRNMMPLLSSCGSVNRVIADEDQHPHCDYHLPLLSLPSVLKTNLNTIPAGVPYLFPAALLVKEWRIKLQDVKGFRIGINWHGRVGRADSTKRDISVSYFAPLAEISGVRLISLQRDDLDTELAKPHLPAQLVSFGDEFDRTSGAFMDAAAIMMNVDLVITSDTSVAHLAGALGVPVWVALPYVPDWRWMLDRDDSPWYPTMRLFRQGRAGDWAEVFSAVRLALTELVHLKNTAAGGSGS